MSDSDRSENDDTSHRTKAERHRNQPRLTGALLALAALGGFSGMASLVDAVGRLVAPWRPAWCVDADSTDESQKSRERVHLGDRSGTNAETRDRPGCDYRVSRVSDERVR